jgi:hypothetical protein
VRKKMKIIIPRSRFLLSLDRIMDSQLFVFFDHMMNEKLGINHIFRTKFVVLYKEKNGHDKGT